LRITIIVLPGFIAINSILTVGPDLEVSWKTDTKGVDALLITIDAVGIPITGSWCKGWGTSRNGSGWHTADLPVTNEALLANTSVRSHLVGTKGVLVAGINVGFTLIYIFTGLRAIDG
jgi:hypothetical protein